MIKQYGHLANNYDKDLLGGYGGYSAGNIYLNLNDILYINVGQSGGTSAENNVGNSYNGGGTGGGGLHGDRRIGSSGGGATHIATISGLLSTLEDEKDSILIVSGGGGGSYTSLYYGTDYPGNYGNGGSGGGFKGGNGIVLFIKTGDYSHSTGGTQTEAGEGYDGYLKRSNGYASFGIGQSCYADGDTSNGSGGGGGFYGGGNGAWIQAAGGSGYIGNTLLTNKYMTCYNCETSDEESTKTISNTCSSENPKEDCAKIGNGYARITYLGK